MKRPKKRKKPQICHAGITIREVRQNYFMIDVFRQGKRERKCFDSLDDAKLHAEQIAIAIKNEGASVLDLTPEQRQDAVSAIRKAGGRVTLVKAVECWLQYSGITKGITVSEIGDKWLAEIKARGCRDTTIRERKHKLTRLSDALGDRVAASISKSDIIAWFDALGLTGETRDGYRRCLKAMFNYAVEDDLLESSPVAGIKRIKTDEKLPECFTTKQVSAILKMAEQYAPVIVPTLAVQFFAGLRPGEAKALDWRHVDFDEGIIRIMPETSKVRRARIVDISPTLKAWLLPYRKQTGAVGITTQNQFDYYMTRKPIDEVKGIIKAAGVEWIQDGPRHTFASMHYATNQDAATLAAILGHTGGHDIFFRHYRGLVKKTEAAKYWKIKPSKESKVIQFEGAA